MIRKLALQMGMPTLLALMAWNAYFAVSHLKGMQTITALTMESSAIQAELSGVLNDLTDMETGQRGFLLTGDATYLQPYSDAKTKITTDFVALRAGLAHRKEHEQSLE
jgi:CHASE3 domain sensor protein